ncbi:MAG TPA: hypothetical protein VHF51_11965 [Solirubrobacteraceae bacterium]|nr:hypothetical protein [Solirubrobacteraceae bacterium]
MTDETERRTDLARRRRVDQLLERVRSARDEIIDRGLDAVHGQRSRDGEDPEPTPPPKRP